MQNENYCAYCEMNTTTPYGVRGKSLGGGMIYSFISNGNVLVAVSGSNSKSNKIYYCPMCGKKLE